DPAAAVFDDRERHSQRGGLDAAHRAAVRDYEDAAAVRMELGDPAQRVQDPLLVRLGRLADELAAVALDRGQGFPVSPVLLPQITIKHDRKPESLGDDL